MTRIEQNQKHVVIIMADQLRYDALGEHTPHLKQLLAESVVFDRAYCASPLCVPARGAFFTGKYPNETGCLINPWLKQDAVHGVVKEEHINLYNIMAAQGWDSWHAGKQHLSYEPKLHEREHSTTRWLPMEKRYAAFVKAAGHRKPGEQKEPDGPRFKAIVPEMAGGKTTRVKSYSLPTTGCYEAGFEHFFDGFILQDCLHAIRNRDQAKPLLLNAMFLAPHPPLDIPEPWFSMVRKPELPDNVGKWYPNQSPLQMYNLTGFFGSRYERSDWERIWEVYLGLVALLDDCVGAIVAELKQQGIYDETLIVFTSDHGEMLGSHRLWQKMCMYEESVRTPLAFKFPSAFTPAVTRSEVLVSSVDVLPTLCDYLGLHVSSGLSGVSLLPLINGGIDEADFKRARDKIFIQYDGNGALGNFQRCVVKDQYKLIVDMFKDEVFLELYNVISDPQETENLIFDRGRFGSVIEGMLFDLRTHMRATGDLLDIADRAYEVFLEQYAPFKHPADHQ